MNLPGTGPFDLTGLMKILPFLIPIVLLDVGLKIYCLISIFRTEGMARDRKILWTLVVLLVSTFGSLAYLLFGRSKDE